MVDGKYEKLKFHGNLTKTYVCCLGEVTFKKAYYKNKNASIFPIEEKHTWLKDDFLPNVKKLSCFVSMQEPYDMASVMLEKIGGIKISSSSLQKITKSIGDKLVKIEDEKLEKQKIYKESEKEIDLLVVSCDGACVKTKGDWKEVKTGAVYEIKKEKKGNQKL
jgi:hypothetical protein